MKLIDLAEKTNSRNTFFQKEWLDIMKNFDFTNNIKTINIPVGLTKSYLGNFYGLLNNDIGIGSEYWYPHLLINNFNSSLDYNGETEIKIIDSNILEDILNIFKKQKDAYTQ